MLDYVKTTVKILDEQAAKVKATPFILSDICTKLTHGYHEELENTFIKYNRR